MLALRSSGWASTHEAPSSNDALVITGRSLSSSSCQPRPALEATQATAAPAAMVGITDSTRWRAPRKFTFRVSMSEKGGPGRPATLNTESTDPSPARASSIDDGSRRSTVRDSTPSTSTVLTSSAVTRAPSSTSRRAVASPMPEAAPVTSACVPS
jgi:hypothetical protein